MMDHRHIRLLGYYMAIIGSFTGLVGFWATLTISLYKAITLGGYEVLGVCFVCFSGGAGLMFIGDALFHLKFVPPDDPSEPSPLDQVMDRLDDINKGRKK